MRDSQYNYDYQLQNHNSKYPPFSGINEIKITDKYCSHECHQADNVLKN